MNINTQSCSDGNGTQKFKCTCNHGFEGERCEIDLCDDVTCENGFCDAGNCICDSGYINNGNICIETCELNPCEVMIKITIATFTSILGETHFISFYYLEYGCEYRILR